MRHRKLTVLIERDGDGFDVAIVPSLQSCYTHARSRPVLRRRIAEMIRLCLEHERSSAREFVAAEQVEIPA